MVNSENLVLNNDCVLISIFRALRILPNRFLGVLGKHHGFPIEKVRASADGEWLASTSHDSTIR